MYLRVLEKFAKKLILRSKELIFRRYGLTKYALKFQRKVMRCHLIGGTSLQLSCETTCFNSKNNAIRAHLLVLKVNIFISDKVERYDGQEKHQGSLRLYTTISLTYAILESWLSKRQILMQSGQLHMFHKYRTGYDLCA